MRVFLTVFWCFSFKWWLPLGQSQGNFVVWILVPVHTMNHTPSGRPQASLPIHQEAKKLHRVDRHCCLLSLLKAGTGGKRDFAPFRSSDKLPSSLLDCSLTPPFKSHRKSHGEPGSLVQVPPVTLPAAPDGSALSRHSYTTLLHNPCQALGCLQEGWEEGQAAGRPRTGWGKPAQVLGADEGTEGRAEHVGFGTRHREEAPSQPEQEPQPQHHTSPSYSAIPQVMALPFFYWGLSWLGGDELWDVSSEYFLL